MTHKNENYQSYLLRLQRTSEHSPWRISIQDAHSGEEVRFRSEKELFQYLVEKIQPGKEMRMGR